MCLYAMYFCFVVFTWFDRFVHVGIHSFLVGIHSFFVILTVTFAHASGDALARFWNLFVYFIFFLVCFFCSGGQRMSAQMQS